MKIVEGKTVSCVKGYKAAGCHVGLKNSGKKDMAVIYSEVPAVSAGVGLSPGVHMGKLSCPGWHCRRPRRGKGGRQLGGHSGKEMMVSRAQG